MKFWGVRGSLPSDQSQTFGVHTTCVEVKSGQDRLIIDGGSGLRNLGESLLRSPTKGQGEFHILMTHFHWDHILGIPFFVPHFFPNTVIHYYAVQPELAEVVKLKFQRPMFPVPFESLPAKIHFHTLKPRTAVEINGFSVTPYLLDHPDPCWGFKISRNGKVYSHCVDTEGVRKTKEELGEDLAIYQNADVLYYDAQYTLPELQEKASWGHSASQIGLQICMRENTKHLLFGHHDPGATEDHLRDLINQTQRHHDQLLKEYAEKGLPLPITRWQFIKQDYEIEV